MSCWDQLSVRQEKMTNTELIQTMGEWNYSSKNWNWK